MTEQVSAFVDGEMDREQLEQHIQQLLSDKQAMQAYQDYQYIGEVLRAEQTTPNPLDLTSQIMANIDAEPTVLSPNAIQAEVAQSSTTQDLPVTARDAGTQKLSPMWSIAASVAAVVAVGLLSWQKLPADQDRFAATAQRQTVAEVTAQPIKQLDQIPSYYLEAHHVSAPSVGSHFIQPVHYSK